MLSHAMGVAGLSDTSVEGALCSLQGTWEMDLWEWEVFLCLTSPTWGRADEFPFGWVKLSR